MHAAIAKQGFCAWDNMTSRDPEYWEEYRDIPVSTRYHLSAIRIAKWVLPGLIACSEDHKLIYSMRIDRERIVFPHRGHDHGGITSWDLWIQFQRLAGGFLSARYPE